MRIVAYAAALSSPPLQLGAAAAGGYVLYRQIEKGTEEINNNI